MRASRLLSMLILLQMRGSVSATSLAQQFEVSVRTIYRDVDALSAAGVPIYAEVGRHGGIRLHPGYRTRVTGLTLAEAAALPVAHLAGAAKDLGMASEALAAQLKVLASLPPDAGATAQAITDRFHCDPSPWYQQSEELACLPALAAAVWRGKRLDISYTSWRGQVRRRLDPVGLVQKGGLWYLVAIWRGKPLTYRAASIESLHVLDQAARRPPGFDLATYWTGWCSTFERKLMGQMARVRISPEGLEILRAVVPMMATHAQRTRSPPDAQGWFEAELPFETEAYSARQILRLGAQVEVLAPEDLRRAVAQEAQAVLAQYTPSDPKARPKR
ncbi:MAG: helix-turn-helix transcriptional regulator [Caulobacterales bacterium]